MTRDFTDPLSLQLHGHRNQIVSVLLEVELESTNWVISDLLNALVKSEHILVCQKFRDHPSIFLGLVWYAAVPLTYFDDEAAVSLIILLDVCVHEQIVFFKTIEIYTLYEVLLSKLCQNTPDVTPIIVSKVGRHRLLFDLFDSCRVTNGYPA